MAQRHYFMNIDHKPEDYFSFNAKFRDMEFKINSCNDIFSKNEIDEGTKVLLNTVLDKVITDPENTDATFLDMGCGYGIIGLVLGTCCPNATVDMSDINKTAVGLALKNADQNEVFNVRDVFISDGYAEIIGSYDYIITNPPIRAGKDVLFRLVGEGIFHLNDGGKIVVVIRKDLGEETLRKLMLETFGNCEILKRDSGFYILSSQKNPPTVEKGKK